MSLENFSQSSSVIPVEELDSVVFGEGMVEEEQEEQSEEVVEDESKEEEEVSEELDIDLDEELKEEAKEEDKDEEKIEESKSPKLKALLKREAKLLEQRKEIESVKKSFEEDKKKFDEELSQYNMEEIRKIQKFAEKLKEGDATAKKELWGYVGVSAKDFLSRAFEMNPKFVRETFKEYLDKEGKSFDPETKEREKELAQLRREKEETEKILKEKETKEIENNYKKQLVSSVKFTEETPILQSLPADELGDVLLSTIRKMTEKNPALKSKKISEIIPSILPKLEQHYERMYEPVIKAYTAKKSKQTSKSKTEVKDSVSKTESKPGKTLHKKSSTKHSSKDDVISKLPADSRAKALAELGLLDDLI
jgi:hypothetical protein